MDLVVCDDHPVVRAGLIRIISEGVPLTSVREADNGQALLDLLRKRAGDVVLLDIGLPGRSGLDVLPQLKREWPRLPVLILSMHSADRYAVRALRAGASGYLTKGAVNTELVKAVTTVLSGHKYVTADVAESLADNLNHDDERPRHDALTVREFEVMSQLAAGRSVSHIAADLCLSYNTISTYRARVLRKLGVSSNAELMRYALQHGLTE
jgi:two-component system invasion response regulator UvrY